MAAAIECHELTKTFLWTLALDNLEFEVPEGSVYALVGANGAGKSTLMKTLVNLLRPTSGLATVLGVDSRRLSATDLQRIGYVSENQELPEWMTVQYFLNYLKPFYPTWDSSLADELVRDFELPLDRTLGRLSRGMKMKAALASSLAYRPKLLLLDEPFSGLDALVRDEFIEGLLGRAGETTVVISSHELAELETFVSHIGFLQGGRIQFSEENGALVERFREVEVTMPETVSIPEKLPTGWLGLRASESLVRFVHSQFDAEKSSREVRTLFPSASNIDFTPMSLREIFVALVKSGRKAD